MSILAQSGRSMVSLDKHLGLAVDFSHRPHWCLLVCPSPVTICELKMLHPLPFLVILFVWCHGNLEKVLGIGGRLSLEVSSVQVRQFFSSMRENGKAQAYVLPQLWLHGSHISFCWSHVAVELLSWWWFWKRELVCTILSASLADRRDGDFVNQIEPEKPSNLYAESLLPVYIFCAVAKLGNYCVCLIINFLDPAFPRRVDRNSFMHTMYTLRQHYVVVWHN